MKNAHEFVHVEIVESQSLNCNASEFGLLITRCLTNCVLQLPSLDQFNPRIAQTTDASAGMQHRTPHSTILMSVIFSHCPEKSWEARLSLATITGSHCDRIVDRTDCYPFGHILGNQDWVLDLIYVLLF